jgi:hypothetical protein
VASSSIVITETPAPSAGTVPHFDRTVGVETVTVPKHLLIHVAGKLIESQKRAAVPGNDWLIFYGTTAVATLFLLATTQFHDTFGQPAERIGGFALFVLVASIFGTIYYGYRIVTARRAAKPPMTADDWYEELCREMEAETKRVADLERAARQAALPTSGTSSSANEAKP